MNKILKDFWDIAHKHKVKAYLTDIGPTELIAALRLNSILENKKLKILDFGCGTGNISKFFNEQGHEVSVLDISEIALENARPYCKYTFNTEQLTEIPTGYYDLILSTNVVQHIPTETLIPELEALISSLKLEGYFVFEFVSKEGIKDNGLNCPESTATSGTICRSPQFFKEFFESRKCDFELVMIHENLNLGCIDACYCAKVTKRGEYE